MKLFYSPGACSLAPHIILEESGLSYEAIATPTKTHQLPDGSDYYKLNPLGYVPLLIINEEQQLREAAVILQFIADLVPNAQLAPANGSFARAKLQEWLNFIATEVHKGFSPLFHPATPVEYKAIVIEKLQKRLQFIDQELSGKSYLMGEQFTVADAYLFTVTNWARLVKVDLSSYTNLIAYRQHVMQRPSIIAAMKAEGIYKPN